MTIPHLPKENTRCYLKKSPLLKPAGNFNIYLHPGEDKGLSDKRLFYSDPNQDASFMILNLQLVDDMGNAETAKWQVA